jgi:hypothetical protein
MEAHERLEVEDEDGRQQRLGTDLLSQPTEILRVRIYLQVNSSRKSIRLGKNPSVRLDLL